MQGKRDHRLRRGLVVGAMAVTMALPTTAAFGDSASHRDPSHDVVESLTNKLIRPASGNRTADIVHVRFAHTSRRILTSLRVRHFGHRLWWYLEYVKTPTARYVVSVAGRQKPLQTHLTRGFDPQVSARRVPCDGLSAVVSRGTDTIRASVPATCLRRPRWVRMDAGYLVFAANTFIDDALQTGFDVHRPPRVTRRLSANPEPAPSPGTSRQAVAGERVVFSRFVPMGRDEIRNEVFSSRPDGTHVRRLTFGHDNIQARWSPQGHRILYLRDGRLSVMRANGHDKHRVLGSPAFGEADWAPSGNRIVVARGGGEFLTGLLIRSLRTGTSRELTGKFASPNHPRWSPDGQRILFEATPTPRTDVRDLFVIKPDGTGLRNLTSTRRVEEFDAEWSQDGRRIVYVRSRTACQRLHVMRKDGTAHRGIGRGCNDAEPTWSPNGHQIMFSPLDDRFGISHLVVIQLNGSHRHVVSRGHLPDWRH